MPTSGRRDTARGSVQCNSYHGIRSETIPQLETILPEVEWSRFRPSRPGHAVAGAQPECQIQVTTPLRVVAPAPHHGVYKRMGHEPLVCRHSCSLFLLIVPVCHSCSSFLSARYIWLGIDSPPIPLLAPPYFTNSPADSAFLTTSLPFSAYLLRTPSLSTHWLLTPPKSLPSRPTVASHSLDRR